MRNGWVAVSIIGAFLFVQGCSGYDLYPDTDIVELKGFALKTSNVQKKDGLAQSGTWEYSGTGDLVEVYRAFMVGMKDNGWVAASDEIVGDKASGTLRKDNRTCSVQFVMANQQMRATLKVGPSK